MSGSPPGAAPLPWPPEALREVVAAYPFPDPREADARGLIGYGGDLSPERLLAAYAQGIFPWYDEDPILWFSPDPRMLLAPGELHVPKSLAKTIRRAPYEIRFDTAFEAVISACRDAYRPGQGGTWITEDMVEGYCELHRLGFAHSVESWCDDELVGGLYGVSLGGAFFGESMFAYRSDASKIAFVGLVERVREWGFEFVDCQVYTEHLDRFGACERPRDEFLTALARVLETPTLRGSWSI